MGTGPGGLKCAVRGRGLSFRLVFDGRSDPAERLTDVHQSTLRRVDAAVSGPITHGEASILTAHVLCHVYADGQIVATFEPQGYFACTVENQPILAGLWHGLGSGWYVLFGDNRMPVTVMCGAALAGIILGLRYTRRRLLAMSGIEPYYGIPAIGGKDPWRQMVLLCLAGSVFLSSVPQSAFADSPTTYDPVFYYYHNDHLGSASIMTDRQGNVVQRYGYTPFGKERYKQEKKPDNPLIFDVSSRYTGQTLDDETGLYYYGARYYDPEIARFIQADAVVPNLDSSQTYTRGCWLSHMIR
jgi:RHS repeat-associated protein